MKMSLSGLCTLFSKVTLFSLRELFCGPQICQKCVGGRGSAPDPAGGAHDAPPDPLVGWGGGHPLSIPHPTRHLRCLDSRAFGAQLPWPPQCKILATPLLKDDLRQILNSSNKRCTVVFKQHFKPARTVHRVALGTVYNQRVVGLRARSQEFPSKTHHSGPKPGTPSAQHSHVRDDNDYNGQRALDLMWRLTHSIDYSTKKKIRTP